MGFEKHEINESINKSFQDILNSSELKDFSKGLEYKSKKTRETDEKAFKLLIDMLGVFKDGWIQANACQTAELYRKNEIIDTVFGRIKEFNKSLNKLIISLRDTESISPESLEKLREIEKQLMSYE